MVRRSRVHESDTSRTGVRKDAADEVSGLRSIAIAELTRPAPRRPLFRHLLDPSGTRPGVAVTGSSSAPEDQQGGSPEDDPVVVVRRRVPSPASLLSSLPQWAVTAAIVVVVVVGVGAWSLLRRSTVATGSLPHVADAVSETTTRPSTTPLRDPVGSADPSSTSRQVTPSNADGKVIVHVAGAVIHPGVVTLPSGSRAVDAVNAVGGFAEGADPDRLNLAAPLIDGERLAVPLIGQPPPQEVAPVVSGVGGTGSAPASGGAGAGAARIDLNAATPEQLDTLPGVGPSTAAAIIAYRNEHGPFRSVDGLLEVRGIGETRLEALRDLVTVDGR